MGFDYLCTVNPSGLWIETKKQAAAFAVVTVFAVWFYRELFGSLFFLLRSNEAVVSDLVFSRVIETFVFTRRNAQKRVTLANVFYYNYCIWTANVILDIPIVGVVVSQYRECA